MLWDLLQQGQIGQANATAESAKQSSANNAERLHKEVLRLEARMERLAIITQGLWELLREKADLTEKDIEAKIAEIDIRDGRKDGKILGKPTTCPKCERPTHTRLRSCPYCGTALDKGHIVEKS
ncbi:MAG: zinc ribbon domain-containing protein [Thiobacillus sp.]|nr:zinc ribbon domain-containing protein [Thiobacillus sp.]